MFDYNCDMAQGYGVYRNDAEYEIAKYASSLNISAGFHAGDPISIHNALKFAQENNLALGVHIGYPDIQGFGKRTMDMSKEELIATVKYQVGTIIAYAKTMDLEIEQIRAHGALKDKINSDKETALIVAQAIKEVCPWLNFIVQNPEIKEAVEEFGVKSAYEVEFKDETTIREIRELEIKPDTLHFKKLDNIKRAYDVLKPTPINYNKVHNQI